MMGLLLDIPYAGASCDYLYSRIRSRRAALNTVGRLRAQGGDPQQALMAEYRWVYRQLDRRLRRELLPFFEYFELRLLVVALRYLAVGERSAMNGQLQQSLFQSQVHRALQTSERVATAVKRLEQLFAEEYPGFTNLTETYLRQGPGGLEQALIGGYLLLSIGRTRSPEVRQFLVYLIDMRNLQTLSKHLRWQVPLEPPLLPGGRLALADCERIWLAKDHAALLVMMQKFTHQGEEPEEGGIEDFLLQGVTVELKRAGRDPLRLGLVIDYLWRCRLAARSQGLRLYSDRTASVEPSFEVPG